MQNNLNNLMHYGVYRYIDFVTESELDIPYIEFVDSTVQDRDEYFTYDRTIVMNNIRFDLFNDDYGQSYFLYYKTYDSKEIEEHECCCGTYNFDYLGVAAYESRRVIADLQGRFDKKKE